MRRRDAVLLLVAGLVGASGGVSLALDDPATPRLSASPDSVVESPSPAARTAPPRAAPLLYATSDRIVDGDRTTPHDLGAAPLVLVRASGGYLLSAGEGGTEADRQELTFVARDGEATPIGTVTGEWDLDEDGTRVVGVEQGSGRVVVWGLDGEVEVTGDTALDPRTSVVFADDAIIASEQDSSRTNMLVRIDPRTGRTRRLDAAAPAYLTASRDGRTLAGAVNLDRVARLDDAYCTAARPADQSRNAWSTCDWRRQYAFTGPELSPSGTSILATPFQSDGFGPAEFALLDVERGPARLTRIDAPDFTWEASFADDTSLYVRASSHDRSDGTAISWFFRCTEDSCRRIAEDPDRDARLGTTR